MTRRQFLIGLGLALSSFGCSSPPSGGDKSLAPQPQLEIEAPHLREHPPLDLPGFEVLVPTGARQILLDPDTMEIFELDQAPQLNGSGIPEAGLDGRLILDSKFVTDRSAREAILRSLIADAEGGNSFAFCFSPRHAIRLRRGDDVLEMAICFECLRIEGSWNEESFMTFLTARCVPEITRLFLEQGVGSFGSYGGVQEEERRRGLCEVETLELAESVLNGVEQFIGRAPSPSIEAAMNRARACPDGSVWRVPIVFYAMGKPAIYELIVHNSEGKFDAEIVAPPRFAPMTRALILELYDDGDWKLRSASWTVSSDLALETVRSLQRALHVDTWESTLDGVYEGPWLPIPIPTGSWLDDLDLRVRVKDDTYEFLLNYPDELEEEVRPWLDAQRDAEDAR